MLGNIYHVQWEKKSKSNRVGEIEAEGDGTVDAENMLEALKNSSGANLQGELSHIIRQLQACSLVPGEALI